MTEVIVYQATAEQVQAAYNFSVIPTPIAPAAPKSAGLASGLSIWALKISRILAVVGIALIIFTYAPSVWYWAQSQIGNYSTSFALSQTELTKLSVYSNAQKPTTTPAFDPKLSVINHLSIASIGVDTDIQEATLDNYEEALKKGVWRVSDFGAPNETGTPVILAAHRFGYLAWTNLFRHKNSFFNLPKVKTGDTVSIIWRQRKYTYEVYAVGKGTEITDYSADLILYTCENLAGPEREFVYGRLIPV